jgi:aldose 1-epimerase
MAADSKLGEDPGIVPGAARDVHDQRYLLVAPSGVSALVSSWGAGLVSLYAPDRQGQFNDIVLGFDEAADYAVHPNLYFGCTVGRVANRIRNARFQLNGSPVALAANNGRHHLHGGPHRSFDRVGWEAAASETDAGARVVFRRVSPHLEEGYPGRVEVTVTYTMTAPDDLWIDYEARTDRTTPLSLTNHTYWNLAGAGAGSILDHVLEVAAHSYTPTDAELIPVGSIEPVDGTALDFRSPRRIGERISELEPSGARGYDHNLVLAQSGPTPAFAARLAEPRSGRVVEVWTTQPCIQFYSGNLMIPTNGKLGRHYPWRSGLCLEPQGYPDAVNNPAFTSVLLSPDQVYRQTIAFRVRTDSTRPDGKRRT